MSGAKNDKPTRNDDSPSPNIPDLLTTWSKKKRSNRARASRDEASPSSSIKGKDLPINKRVVWAALNNHRMVKTIGNQRTKDSPSSSRKDKELPANKRLLHRALYNHWMVKGMGRQRSNGTRDSRLNASSSSSRKEKELPIKKRLAWPPVGNDWMVKTIGINDIAELHLNLENLEEYISPFLNELSDEELEGSGRSIDVWDIDRNTEHTLLLKRLNHHGCRTHILSGTWRNDFVHRRSLKVGDKVAFCWDEDTSRFKFSAKKYE